MLKVPCEFIWIPLLSSCSPGGDRGPRETSEAPAQADQLGTPAQPGPTCPHPPQWRSGGRGRSQPSDQLRDWAPDESGLLLPGHPESTDDCTEQYRDGQEHPPRVCLHPLYCARAYITQPPLPRALLPGFALPLDFGPAHLGSDAS